MLIVTQLSGFGAGDSGTGGTGGIDSFTVLMLHFDGADGSTTFTDSSLTTPHTFTRANAVAITTAQSKFGGACLDKAQNGYITCPGNADFDFGTGNFTIDFWVRFNTTTRGYCVDQQTNYGTIIITPSSGLVEIYDISSGHIINAGATAFSTGVWYHIALVRNGTSWVVYRDGTSYVSATSSSAFGNSTSALFIGSAGNGSWQINAWFDEMRFSKGIARWTANFTPPTAPYS